MTGRLDLSACVQRPHGGLPRMDLAVEGVGCAGCIRKIEGGLLKMPGVVEARLNFTNRRLAVEWREGEADPADILRELEAIGYRAHPFRAESVETEEARHGRWLLRCLAVAGFAGMNVMLLSVSVWSGGADMGQETRDLFHWISALVALPAAAYAGQPFYRSAWRALRAGALNMDVPISLGVILALGLSVVETAMHERHAYFDSALMLMLFLLCGRYLEHAMRRKTREVAGNLAALKAETAHRFGPGDEIVTVPVSALQPGDRLLVRPGERVPADGLVIGGSPQIDESLVSGETAPRMLTPNEQVHAGSLNLERSFTLRVTAAGQDTLLADVELLLERAAHAKSGYLRLADRAARAYAPMVHTAAGLTLLAWLASGASMHQAVVTAIAVLIITCPCALALAVPAVQVVASGAMFRAGIVLQSGDAIERLAECDTIVFDKTGTLTLPEPRLANEASVPAELVGIAAQLALSSRHPLAAAVAKERPGASPAEGAIEEPGRGVRAVIGGAEARLGSAEFCGVAAGGAHSGDDECTSQMFVSHGGRQVQLLIRQALRADAATVVRRLKAEGYELRILSGDRPAAVQPVAAELDIAQWRGGLKPADKIAELDALAASGRRVLMVGDGLNDAPALAAAHASLSPVSAVHLAQAHADGVFFTERLLPVWQAVAVARRARKSMRQNLWIAAAYNAVAVPIAFMGFVTPLIAAAAMSGSSLLVTLNAIRVWSPRETEAAHPQPPSPAGASSIAGAAGAA